METVEGRVHDKADRQALSQLEDTYAARLSSIENALLKGLKAVSEKAAAALATKVAVEVRRAARGMLHMPDDGLMMTMI